MSALTVSKEEEKRLKGQGFLNNRGTDEFSARVKMCIRDRKNYSKGKNRICNCNGYLKEWEKSKGSCLCKEKDCCKNEKDIWN